MTPTLIVKLDNLERVLNLIDQENVEILRRHSRQSLVDFSVIELGKLPSELAAYLTLSDLCVIINR